MLTELSLHILLAVGEGAAHGYAIGRDIEERSGGRLDPTTGALYQALKRLTRDGLIRPVGPPKGSDVDARRKYFALTAAGKREVAGEIRRLEGLVTLARERRLYTARAR
ncbi:MAG TPA: PadR family transcriptional regulator [Longimicrobiales bacterium]|nr:PadR family transcriptional regulator [Longimicrobiales bacterium]